MNTNPTTIQAENGTVVEAGGVYVTFSGDDRFPYKVAKVLSVGGGPPGATSIARCITPDMKVVPDVDLWLKAYFANLATQPTGIDDAVTAKGFRILPISTGQFLAWGPPVFPVRLATEPVTPEELAQRVADWYNYNHPPADDPDGVGPPREGETNAILYILGPMPPSEELRIKAEFEPALRRELRDLIVFEEVWRYTTLADDSAVYKVTITFCVSDLPRAVGVIQNLYNEFGFSWRAEVCDRRGEWDHVIHQGDEP